MKREIFTSSKGVIAILKQNQLINIDNSYNNEWDILSELAQNSIDAIHMNGGNKKNQIDIVFDADNKTIVFEDNGCGFELNDEKPNTLLGSPTLLDVNVTTKINDASQIGEKGVGLKFVIFNSNNTIIETCDGNNAKKIVLNNCYDWKSKETPPIPEFEILDSKRKINGTSITLSNLSSRFDNLFQLTKEQLIYVLRTKTAIGRTSTIWDDNLPNIKIQLTYINNGKKDLVADIKSSFHHLGEEHTVSVIDYDDFTDWTKQNDRSDKQKRTKLKNKIVQKKGIITDPSNQRKIKYFILYVPNGKSFKDTSVAKGLCSEENLADERWIENFGYTTFSSGIEISSKGMPTGIKIPNPSTGWSGYWGNIFMLFEDESLVFDIGRKSIDGRSTRKMAQHAKDQFNILLRTITKYITGKTTSYSSHFDRYKIFKEVDKLPNLKSEYSTFIKSPQDQEASVCAIFYELIGNGTLKNIHPLISGYKNQYDLYASVQAGDDDERHLIFEFKSKLQNLIPDLRQNIKYTNDIDCIVCYNVTNDDVDKIEDEGYIIEDYDGIDQEFPNATHKVTIQGAKEYWIIDLFKYLNK